MILSSPSTFFTKNNELFIYVLFNHPVLPEKVEFLLIDNIFTINATGKILNRKKYQSYYNKTDEIFERIKTKLIENGVDRQRIEKINLYIYDCNSINGFALPGNTILITKGAIELLIEKKGKKEKRKEVSKKTSNKTSKEQSPNMDYTFVEFLITHELLHILKRHNLIKTQAMLVNPFVDLNVQVYKKFIDLFIKDFDDKSDFSRLKESFTLMNDLMKLSNNHNVDRIRKLVELIELEVDICSLKYLLLSYDKEKIKTLLEKDFHKYFQKQEILMKQNQNTELVPSPIIHEFILLKDFIENTKLFLQTFMMLEFEHHILHDKRREILLEYLKKFSN